MQYTVDELRAICDKHIKWLRGEAGGEKADLSGANLSRANLSRANLSGADLYGADLSGANLYGADLSRADLSRANLSGANLSRANLSGADLYGADLYGADLSGADLSRADLSRANLSGADLYGADLYGADLSGANLSGADLYGADLSRAENATLAWALTVVAPEGDLTGWKKARSPSGGTCIVKLRIPAEAKRSNATGRKCRAEWVEVLAVEGAEYGKSDRDPSIEYRVGQTVRPDSWDDNRWEECSHGIHFFITREEAEAWEL